MIPRDELATYLHTYLGCARLNDDAPNGLQVEGIATIQRICTAVSASDAVIKKAVSWGADALFVHHGYFWRRENPTITGMKRRRIGRLLAHDMNLFAYHLPLDVHAELGNNACLATLLCANSVQMHTVDKIPQLLWSGELECPLPASELFTRLTSTFQREPLLISGTDRPIKRLAWCSGAAQSLIHEAHRVGADAYLSGEISERTYDEAHELGMHYYACGHYATERYGIQALGLHLAALFSLEHTFIDSENPI